MFRNNCLRCSTKVLLNNSQNSQEITCAKISLARNFTEKLRIGVFLWIGVFCFPEKRCFPVNFAKCFGTTFSLDASGWLFLIMSLTENILCFYRWIRIHFGFSWHNFYWDNDVMTKSYILTIFLFLKGSIHPRVFQKLN